MWQISANACYAFYGFMSELDYKEMDRESGSEIDFELNFSGNCKEVWCNSCDIDVEPDRAIYEHYESGKPVIDEVPDELQIHVSSELEDVEDQIAQGIQNIEDVEEMNNTSDFAGGFGGALMESFEIENATQEEL